MYRIQSLFLSAIWWYLLEWCRMTFEHRKETRAQCECCTCFSQEHRNWDCCVFIQLTVCLGTRGLSPSPCASPPSSVSATFKRYPVWAAVRFSSDRRAGEAAAVVKRAVESGTRCPKSLQEMRSKMLYHGVFWTVNKKKPKFKFATVLFFFERMTANSHFTFSSVYEALLPSPLSF